MEFVLFFSLCKLFDCVFVLCVLKFHDTVPFEFILILLYEHPLIWKVQSQLRHISLNYFVVNFFLLLSVFFLSGMLIICMLGIQHDLSLLFSAFLFYVLSLFLVTLC